MRMNCNICGKYTLSVKGCNVKTIKSGGKIYNRIRVKTRECPDCNAKRGYFHHFQCEEEKCPICGLRLMKCNCPITYGKKESEEECKYQ